VAVARMETNGKKSLARSTCWKIGYFERCAVAIRKTFKLSSFAAIAQNSELTGVQYPWVKRLRQDFAMPFNSLTEIKAGLTMDYSWTVG